jgi:asparagine synthetase B (glutamine-hydrolysing)
MILAREHGCRLALNGHYGDQMMHSEAHLVKLSRRLRYFQFRREFAALAESMTDVNPSYWRKYFLEALLRDLTPRFLKPLARRLDGVLRSDQRPFWYNTAFRRRALVRRVNQRRPKGNYFSSHGTRIYGLATSARYLNQTEETNKVSAALGLEEAYPFLDRDLVEFAMAIPAEVVNWQGRSKTEYSRFHAYLQPGCVGVLFGYFDPAGLQNEFSTHKDRLVEQDALAANRVTATVALELWLRRFFEKGIQKRFQK